MAFFYFLFFIFLCAKLFVGCLEETKGYIYIGTSSARDLWDWISILSISKCLFNSYD